MTIGERIRKRREELGMTQEELAVKLGYKSRSSVNKVENSRELSNKKVKEYADILNVTPSYLMGWEDNPFYDAIAGEDSPFANEMKQRIAESYYLNEDAKDLAQFMYDNPEYKVLFDATRKVKAEDIEIVKALLDKFKDES